MKRFDHRKSGPHEAEGRNVATPVVPQVRRGCMSGHCMSNIPFFFLAQSAAGVAFVLHIRTCSMYLPHMAIKLLTLHSHFKSVTFRDKEKGSSQEK